MLLNEIYKLAIALGMEADIRKEELKLLLEQHAENYSELIEEKKKYYDEEKLTNPYSDTRILYGNVDEKIECILCGIDIETPEILLADRLRDKGKKIDLLLAHHPEGVAQARLYEVMKVQEDMLADAGVPINIAEGIMAGRIAEVKRAFMPVNHQRAVDAARLLKIPFLCVHSPADNLVNRYLTELFISAKPKVLEDIINLLSDIPEYKEAKRLHAGPEIVIGSKHNKAGKIMCKMSGGTGGPDTAFAKLAQAGVGTYICMHIQEKHRQAAKDNHINVIVAGHMASDSLGMNLFLDHLEQQGIEIIPAAGLIRVSRNANKA